MADVEAATPPKLKAEIFMNFLLEVDIIINIFFLVQSYLQIKTEYMIKVI